MGHVYIIYKSWLLIIIKFCDINYNKDDSVKQFIYFYNNKDI